MSEDEYQNEDGIWQNEEGVWEDGFIIFVFSLEEAQRGTDGLGQENLTPEPWKSMLAKIGVYGSFGLGGYRFDEKLTRDEICSALAPFKRGEDYLLLRNRWIAPEDYSLEDAW